MKRKIVSLFVCMAFAAVALGGLSFVKAGPPLLMYGFVGPVDPGPGIDPNNPANFMSGWMYNYDDLALPLIDVTNVVQSDPGVDPAYWDRFTDPEWSAWTVGTEAIAIFETLVGVGGWGGAENYTGSTDDLMSDAAGSQEFPDTNLYAIPTIVAVFSAPDTVDLTWVGMDDDMGANIVNYTVYHSPDGVVYSQVGFSTAQIIGGPVDFVHTPVTYGLNCYNIGVNYRRDAGGGVYTTIGMSNTVCLTLPTILSTYPANLAIDIPINADVIVNFSHTMDTTTWKWNITPDPGGVWTETWSQTTVLDDTVTLSHAIDFLPCTLYTVTVEYANESSTVQGIIPNPAAPNPWSFTTVCLNPQIILTDPVNNTFNIPLDYPVTITFSKQINTPTFAWQIEQGTDPGGWTETWDPTDTTVTLSHVANLFAENDHLCFNVTAANDMFANPLIAGPVPNPWCFDTESVPPYIINTDPLDGEPGVELNPSIYVNYSEDMVSVGLDTIPICPAPGWTENMVTLRYAIFTCTIQPFLEGQTVIATATGLDNQTLPLAPPTQWTFDTISVQPQINLTSPANGDTNVPLDADIVIDFSEPIDTPTFAWNIFPDPGGLWTETWSNGNQTVTLSHSVNFTECLLYTVTVTDADDMSGLTLAAGPVPNPWSFTAICIPPEIVLTSPADGDIDVAVTDPIVIDFSEQMNTVTWAWNIVPDPGGLWTETWTPGDQTVTLSHSTNFDECTQYTVTVTTANDMSGNGLIPGAVLNPWSFWTFCPEPVIVNRSPGDGATGVLLNEPIVVTFSKSMNTGTVTLLPVVGGLTPSWGQTTRPDDTLTLTHGGFTEVTLYTVDVDGQDTDGLDLNRTASAPLPWTFTTIGVPPNVVEPTKPADLEASVAVDQNIIIQFTETMDATAGQFVYTVTPDPGSLADSWSQTTYLNDTVTITHDSFLECVQYTVEITAARDDSAVNLDPLPYSFTFWAFCMEPFVTSTDPIDGASGVSVSQDVLIRFSEPMATGTAIFNPLLTGEIPSWDGVNMNLTISHDDFTPFTTYTVTISGNDPDMNPLNCTLGPCSFGFTTASLPPTVSITIPDGTEVWSGDTPHDITWDMNDDVTAPADLEVWLNYTSTIAGDGTITTAPLTGLTSPFTYTWTPVCPIDADDVVVVIKVYDGERQVSTNTSAAFTIDCTPPTVVDTTPAIGATDVLPLSADIVINFSEAMAIGNFDWTISPDPDPGGWSESWTADNMNVTLSHSVDFAASTTYTVTITTLTTDASTPGNNLTPAYVFTFATGEPNQPPDADAGPDQTVKVDDTVHFNGTGSSDPDGDTLTYTWDFGDDTTGTGAEPTHTYTEAGSYTVTLTVDDGHGGTATDEMIVTVEEKEADFLSEYWWIFLILIIIIVLIIVVVATRRKKPEEEEYIEEEEVPPPPEEEVEEVVEEAEEVPEEEVEYVEEEPVEEAPLEEEAPVEEAPAEEAAPLAAAPLEAEEAPAEEPAEEPAAEGKVCPNCGTIVGEDDATCFICGTEL